jgi:hypothetical protein
MMMILSLCQGRREPTHSIELVYLCGHNYIGDMCNRYIIKTAYKKPQLVRNLTAVSFQEILQ